RIRELELQREMRKETESRYGVRDDVNQEEKYPSFDSYPRSFEPIYPDIFSEDEPRFDEEEVVNTDYEEALVFDDDPYEAETENIFAQRDIQVKLPTDEILDKPIETPQLQKLDVNDDPVDALNINKLDNSHVVDFDASSAGLSHTKILPKKPRRFESFWNPDLLSHLIVKLYHDNSIKWYQEPRFGLEIWWWFSGSESRHPMLNKENYVPWSSRLLWYAKSRPNRKLIHKSIINGPYVRRMIPEPGYTNREVLVNETFHVQTYDELTEKELKQIKANDQAIQTILLGLPGDIYAVVDSCETAQEIWLRVQQMVKGSDIGIQEKKAKLFNEWERQIAQPGMNMGQDRQMKMVGGNGENKFRQFAGQNVRNLNGYNAVQNVENQVAQNAIQNPRVQNVRNQNGLIDVPGNANQNGNGNLVAARAEGNAAGCNADLDEIEEVNANCILMANLQQALTSGTQTDKALVYDLDGSAEVHDYENCNDNEIFNMFTQEELYT
nr:integrase, catalytic region, zinc finger, CCHC-type, peptidase aspartic, catalytic [Tanacetum cinerariifolium]